MTPDEAADFIRGDCQDAGLKAKADREADNLLTHALRDPEFKRRWDANIQAMADRIDQQIAETMYARYRQR